MLYQNEISIRTRGYGDYFEITEHLENELKRSGVGSGVLIVNSLHTTIALLVQEPDPAVHRDGLEIMDKIAPSSHSYHHNLEGNRNGAAHQKQMLLNSSLTIPVKQGRLMLGTWQRVYLVELFQPMLRRIYVTILGDGN